jgi:translation initiation factor 1
MPGLFHGTPLERPVTCATCERPLAECACPRDASGRVLPPQAQTALVRCQKRRQGKVVTTVGGLDPVASDLPAILKRLREACGAGGALSEEGLEIQGDHRQRVAAALRSAGYRVREA